MVAKPIILGGWLFLPLAVLFTANADSITAWCFGRAVQGMGAIAVLALAASLTTSEQRTKVMAIIGMCIGGSLRCPC